MPTFSVVIPTLNEVDNIDPLLTAIFDACQGLQGLEVVVVDDQSTDGTAEKVAAWSRQYPVRLVCRQGPPDLSGAVLDGVRAAQGQWVAVMDADGSHPADALPRLFEPLQDGSADISIGSRRVAGGQTLNWPWHRHLTSWVASLLAWPFTEVRDPMAGFFAASRDRLLTLQSGTAGYKILLELLVKAGDEARVLEVPITFADRERGQSKLGLSQQATYLRRLMHLGGGRVSLESAGKFILVGLTGMVVDLLIFYALISAEARVGSAHIFSFVIATLTNFALNYRWTFSGDAQLPTPLATRYLRFLVVAVMALMLRGGVLVLLVETLHMPAMLAIFPAIVVTAGVNYLGSAFYVFASTASGVISRVRWHLAAIGLLVYMLVLRLMYMGQLEMIPDEMYYYVFSQRLSLSYLDHPPLVAWLVLAGTTLFGESAFGIRAMLLPLSLMLVWYVYQYGATMLGRTAGLMSVLALASLPVFFASGILMTPDTPMLVAWAAALYYFKRGLMDNQSWAFWRLGVAMGLGLIAKYSLVLLAPAAFVFMLTDRAARQWFFRPQPYLAAAIATVIFLPVLIWNHQNDWASFVFQGTTRMTESPKVTVHWLFIWALLMLSPVVAVAGFYLLGSAGRRLMNPKDPNSERKRRFMWWMTVVPLSVFFVHGLLSVTKFHWTIPPWLALLPLIMMALVAPSIRGLPVLGRFHSGLIRSWPPLLLAMVLLWGLIMHAYTLGLPGFRHHDFGAGWQGWAEMAEASTEIAEAIEAERGRPPIIVGMNRWGNAAQLYYYSEAPWRERITSRHVNGMSGSMWEFWFEMPENPSQQPVLLVKESRKQIAEAWLDDAFIGLGPVQTRPLYRDGQLIRVLHYRVADGLRAEQVRLPDQRPPE